MLSNLGGTLRARFEWAGDGADLDTAIEAGRRAVEITPPGHPGLAVRLSNLGNALASRFEQAGTARTWTPRSRPSGEPSISPRPATPASPGT